MSRLRPIIMYCPTFGYHVDANDYHLLESDGRMSGIYDGYDMVGDSEGDGDIEPFIGEGVCASDFCESTFDIWGDNEPDYFDYDFESDEPTLWQDEYEDLDHTF